VKTHYAKSLQQNKSLILKRSWVPFLPDVVKQLSPETKVKSLSPKLDEITKKNYLILVATLSCPTGPANGAGVFLLFKKTKKNKETLLFRAQDLN